MNARNMRAAALSAEPALAAALQQLSLTPPDQFSQQQADALFAHIAWARLSEPGDGTVGGLLAALGAETMLELLVQGTTPARLCADAQQAEFELSPQRAEEALARWTPRLDRSATVQDVERAVAAGLRVVIPSDAAWPETLSDLELHAPVMLWVRGDARHLSKLSLAVVGARAATGYGSHVTAELVDGVCAAGVTIVSGAAYGVDAVAHRTALAAEVPTVAVVAGGADRPYPQAHAQLLDRVSQAGAVCSEMIPGAAPTKWRFLQRNRLIAALTAATLVTEAGMNSGSLNTAGHAAQLGRPIGAVPGPVTSAASAGCHKLLRDYDATLITNAQQACELVGASDELDLFDAADDTSDRDSAWHRRVLDAIPLRGSRTIPDIARKAGLTTEQTSIVLAELELLNRVKRQRSPGEASPKWALARAQ